MGYPWSSFLRWMRRVAFSLTCAMWSLEEWSVSSPPMSTNARSMPTGTRVACWPVWLSGKRCVTYQLEPPLVRTVAPRHS